MALKKIELPLLHPGQRRAFAASMRGAHNPNGRLAIRAGRRWGKSTFMQVRAVDAALKGKLVGWFAPEYKLLEMSYNAVLAMLGPAVKSANRNTRTIRTWNGGLVEFWTLDNDNAGRGQKYHLIFIDEVAFAKENILEIWERNLEPTLFDYSGDCIIASNTNGMDPHNMLWQACEGPKRPTLGFALYHAPTSDNPMIPQRLPGESEESHAKRRLQAIEKIRRSKEPMVFLQEYMAEFINFSGAAFFSKEKLLVPNLAGEVGRAGIAVPPLMDYVFAVVDTAVKTGSRNDGTGVIYFGLQSVPDTRLYVLDWDYVQIEGATLDTWMDVVYHNLYEFGRGARGCRFRFPTPGAYIEDTAAGQILLQQAALRGHFATKIPDNLVKMGKDVRAMSISGHTCWGKVKITAPAHDKTVNFKGEDWNHMLHQVTSFRMGDKNAATRADDLLDCFTYGVALALGVGDGQEADQQGLVIPGSR